MRKRQCFSHEGFRVMVGSLGGGAEIHKVVSPCFD